MDETLSWLDTLTDADLALIPDGRANLLDNPTCRSLAFSPELACVFDAPLWGLLFNTCSGHCRAHLGEIETLKNILREPVLMLIPEPVRALSGGRLLVNSI